jgi:uncharacterized protein YvpB
VHITRIIPTETSAATIAAPTSNPIEKLIQDTTPLPTPSTPPSYPPSHYITDISGHKQFFSIGCEAGVAKDWAHFFGVEINEYNFQYELPLSDNPEKGFVGDVNAPWGQTPPYGYGVHAGPVADLLRKYGLPARAGKNMTVEQIKAEIALDHPVIAWVIGNVVGGVPAVYTDKEGDTVVVAAYEHVVLVTGYNLDTLRYNSNGKFYEVPMAVFENSWGVLENMGIIYDASFIP